MAAKEEEHGTDDGNEGKNKKQEKDINKMEDQEVDDDHIDPYHGNQQEMPEPEDFELPENMDVDGDEMGDEKVSEFFNGAVSPKFSKKKNILTYEK